MSLTDLDPELDPPAEDLDPAETRRLRRWRLVLGAPAEHPDCALDAAGLALDSALDALYGEQERGAGLGGSAPRVARWLGDIREHFPVPIVRVLQRDAMERLGLKRLLLEPELMQGLEPDVHLAATLVSLAHVMPAKAKDTARIVVRRVVEDLERRLSEPMRAAVLGSLDRSVRNHRPRHSEIDWPRTIRANLRHWQPELRTVIPERLLGHGRRRSGLRDIVVAIDQSGSMAASVVYASLFAAVMASLRAVNTRLVAFDTNIVDLSDQLADPVDVLFGVQLGGGTDINRAVAYCEKLIERPEDTIFVLISDLIEGGVREQLLSRCARLHAAGVTCVALLALSDEGRPCFDAEIAAALSSLGIPAFACTPELFPGLMATAIEKRDVGQWAAQQGLVTTRAAQG